MKPVLCLISDCAQKKQKYIQEALANLRHRNEEQCDPMHFTERVVYYQKQNESINDTTIHQLTLFHDLGYPVHVRWLQD